MTICEGCKEENKAFIGTTAYCRSTKIINIHSNTQVIKDKVYKVVDFIGCDEIKKITSVQVNFRGLIAYNIYSNYIPCSTVLEIQELSEDT